VCVWGGWGGGVSTVGGEGAGHSSLGMVVGVGNGGGGGEQVVVVVVVVSKNTHLSSNFHVEWATYLGGGGVTGGSFHR
jgi:hypothetical protein